MDKANLQLGDSALIVQDTTHHGYDTNTLVVIEGARHKSDSTIPSGRRYYYNVVDKHGRRRSAHQQDLVLQLPTPTKSDEGTFPEFKSEERVKI